MPRRDDLHSILIIGSGPIVIGQACEFDYSGTQACRVLREEGYRVILVNSNPATIMTDPDFADATYVEPITPEVVARIIEQERPDAVLPTLGGQTGLNTAMALYEQGVIGRPGTPEMIGANAEAIATAEDRELFKQAMIEIGLNVPASGTAHTMAEAREVMAQLGLPVIIRPAYILGGRGTGIASSAEEFQTVAANGLAARPISEILIEKSIAGWKEYELEVMRDRADNCVIICSIENVDAMGVHTGDSITVAPAQTLTDVEYQEMRDAAFACIRRVGVETGGSNVQFAVNPATGEQVVIEMNPRVSRSSALASKATGFPIAKIAAKLAVGYTLDEIANDITQTETTSTPASFEPTIDYVVTKIPRWAFEKLPGTKGVLGTQMQSVGEAMSIGRTFAESLQKGLRSLEQGRLGLGCDPRNGDFFVGMVYEPDPSLTLIPGLLEFKSVGLDVRKQAINVSAGAQIAFTLNLGGEALNLVGGISGQSAGSVTVWGSLDADDGAWEDPFGIKGLTIVGMGLEVGFTTDFPFIRVGVRGEASIGGGLLDASIAILLDGLDPANAILALRSDAGINLPALVDAMTGVNPGGVLDVALTDLDLYYAPSGGTIAGKVYEPGLRLAAKLGLWGFHASVAGEFDFAGGGSLAGAMDPLVFKAGSTTFLQVTSFSGSGGASINLNFTPSSVAASIDGKIRLLGGAFEYGVQGTLSTSGLSMNLSGGTPGLYQNASLWIGDQRCKLNFGVTVGVKIPIGGFNVDISAGAAVETEVTLQWFAHRVTFSYAAMGHTYSATVSIYVPFASVGDVANAFGNAAGAIASELAGALVNLGAAAFNWFKSNISQAASEAATFFKNIGANAADTAEGLVNHMGAAAGDAVRYLNLGAEESARILRESFNWGVDATGEWLEDTFTMGSGELKSVLNDAGYLAEDVGDWINDTFNPSNW